MDPKQMSLSMEHDAGFERRSKATRRDVWSFQDFVDTFGESGDIAGGGTWGNPLRKLNHPGFFGGRLV